MKTILIKALSIPAGFGGLWLSLRFLKIIHENKDALAWDTEFTAIMFGICMVLASVFGGVVLAFYGSKK